MVDELAIRAEMERRVSRWLSRKQIGSVQSLRQWRMHRGLTQQALDREAGCHCAIYEGGRKPSLGMLTRIAQALRVSVDQIAEYHQHFSARSAA